MAISTAVNDGQDIGSGSCTVFLVDDDLDDLNLAKRVLQSSPYINDIICARDGRELIDLLEARNALSESAFSLTQDNLIILDVHMPGLSGIDILRMLRTNPHTEDIPIMILTGDSGTNNAMDSYTMHSNGFIAKPLTENSLNHIHRIIQRHRNQP